MTPLAHMPPNPSGPNWCASICRENGAILKTTAVALVVIASITSFALSGVIGGVIVTAIVALPLFFIFSCCHNAPRAYRPIFPPAPAPRVRPWPRHASIPATRGRPHTGNGYAVASDEGVRLTPGTKINVGDLATPSGPKRHEPPRSRTGVRS